MSGYNKKTGVYELLSSTCERWFRHRKTLPDELYQKWQQNEMIYADMFRYYGFEVLKEGSGYLSVRATPGQVWEVLSGKESDPAIESMYS